MLFRGNASGHDFQFHLASWIDVAGQWREGAIYPRWAEWANWGFGEPRFVFYPPASWMAGAALGSALPWVMAPGAFIWLALVAAGMSMWKLAREWLPQPQAIVAAVLFAANPYHLVIVYFRSDFAELLASALWPLMLWAALHVAGEEWRRVPLLAAAFAGIWLSNAPAAVIATYSLALIFIVECAVRRRLQPLATGATAIAVGLGVAAFYIVPAAWERRWVQIAQAVADNLNPARNFLFTHSNDPDFMLFNGRVSWVAAGVICATFVAAIFASRKRREFRELWWVLVALAAVAILLMLPVTGAVWRVAPELQFVQFPWRWLEVLNLVCAFLIAAALSRMTRKFASWMIVVLTFAAIGAAATAMITRAWWDHEDVPAMVAAIQSGRGYEGTDEYDPVGCDRYELPGNPDDTERLEGVSALPAHRIGQFDPDSGSVGTLEQATVNVEQWSAERREFTAQVSTPVTLAIRLLKYPAWDVRVDGHETRTDSAPDTGQMLLPLPEGAHRVTIRFRRTPDRAIGDAISVFSALALLAFMAATHKRSP